MTKIIHHSEMVEPPSDQENVYKNEYFHQALKNLLISKARDVQFVFEAENEVVEIPAHKELLAASSTVFNAMFNGELKEKGDVPIVDASVAGFKEFMQFFYNDQVTLTMANIAEVLNLAHKYDVIDGFQSAIDFLKEHLTADKMLWGLELALKYQSDELKAFCKQHIAKDLVNAMNAFRIRDGCTAMISTTNQMLSETMLASVCTEVFSLTKQAISNSSPKYILPFYLSENAVYRWTNISPEETIKFDPLHFDNYLWLHEIQFANAYEKCGSSYKAIPLKGTVFITNDDDDLLFQKEFGVNTNEMRIKLPEPIFFNPEIVYSITIKPSVCGYPSAMAKVRDVNMAFKGKLKICDDPKYSLIDRLHFEELPNR